MYVFNRRKNYRPVVINGKAKRDNITIGGEINEIHYDFFNAINSSPII